MDNHSLTWSTTAGDELFLTGQWGDADYWFETLAESATFGDPQPVEVGLTSLLIDGTRKQTLRHDNRAASFQVVINAPDASAMAAGEAALWLFAQSAGTWLTWTPPDYFGAPTVFEVETSHLEFRFDDLDELRLQRTYVLTWECAPFSRSVDLTTQPAVTVDTSLTIIDDCSSATGWSASEGTPVVSSGALVFTESTSGDNITGLVRSGAIDMTGKPYLVVDWKISVPGTLELFGLKNAEALRTASSFGSDWTRSYFYHPASFSSVALLAFPLPNGATVSVTQVAIAASLPDSATAGHQQLLTIAPGGSARTQGQFEVSTPTNGLGEVTLYTAPAGSAYSPTIRRHLVSSDDVITSSAGNYQTITGASIFQVPVSTLLPGGYAVWARMAALTTDDVDIVWNAQTYIGSTTVGDFQGDVTTCSFAANVWKMYPLGLVTLPPAKVGPAGKVQIGIQRSGSESATVYLYDVFLFHESGDLTVVRCGLGTSATGGPARRLRVSPPSADSPGGLLEVGHATDWSDAFAAGSKASARPSRGHVLHPEGTSVAVFTEGNPDNVPVSVSASWHKRWHTHAGD